MSGIYCRKLKNITGRSVEVDGHGGVEIASRYQTYEDDLVMLDFDEIEKIYFAARAQREAYQAFCERGGDGVEQYEADYKKAMQNEVIMWRKLERK